MSRLGDRQRIKYEERLRQEAREDIERERYHSRQKHIDRMMRNQRYVDENGREGAFIWTLIKWTIAGAVFALVGIIGSIGEKSIWEMSKMMGTSLILFAGIGVWRGITILQSTR
jgi:hypothetical protein